jgi:FkbM family methyltransferase
VTEPRSSPLTAIRDHLGDELRFVLAGASTADRLRIARLLVHLHTRIGRLGLPTRGGRSDREFDLDLRSGHSFRLRMDDVVVIFIFGVGEYDVDLAPLGEVRSLLDLGANVGLASIYLSDRLRPRHVVCAEPAPDSFRLLTVNLERNLPSALPLQAAVVPESGSYRIETEHPPGQVKVVPGEGTVEGMTVSEILDRAGLESVDLMKIDIEGGEQEIFGRAGDWAERVGAILGEVHPPLTVAAAQTVLRPFGFEPLPVPDRPFFEDILYMTRAGGERA